MVILASEIERYRKIRKEAERILTECQGLTTNKESFNLGKEYSDVYIAYAEFEALVITSGKIPDKDYIFQVGSLEGRVLTRIKEIQVVANTNPSLKRKLDEFLIAQKDLTKYLLSIMD